METVRPIEIAKRILEKKDNAEIVQAGLEILKICAQNRDLVHKATNGVKFGDLIADFTFKVESGQTPTIENFPEWAVTIRDKIPATFARKPETQEVHKKKTRIEVKSQANSIVGGMAGIIMLLDTLFEFGVEDLENAAKPDQHYLNQLRSIKDNESTKKFVNLVDEFYSHLQGIIKNHEREIDGLDEAAKDVLKKRHWKKLISLKDNAKESMLNLPEELFA